MKYLLITWFVVALGILSIFPSNAQSQTLTTPLDTVDFRDGNWLFLFCDHQTLDTISNLKTTANCWCIDDPKILSRFKSDFKCDLGEESDGLNEDVVWLYRNGTEFMRFVYPDSGFMQLGRLPEYAVPVVRKDYWIKGHKKYSKKIKKLEKKGAYLKLSRNPSFPHRYEHRIALSYQNKNDEKYRHFQKYYPVLEEIDSIFPELNRNDFGHSQTGHGGAIHIAFYRKEKDKIDINRFIGSDVIRYFKDDGISEILYRITAFLKVKKPTKFDL